MHSKAPAIAGAFLLSIITFATYGQVFFGSYV
jgi:hypothetical protein